MSISIEEVKSERATAQFRTALAVCLREIESDRVRHHVTQPALWLEGALQLMGLLIWLAAVFVSTAGLGAVAWLTLEALGPLGFPKKG